MPDATLAVTESDDTLSALGTVADIGATFGVADSSETCSAGLSIDCITTFVSAEDLWPWEDALAFTFVATPPQWVRVKTTEATDTLSATGEVPDRACTLNVTEAADSGAGSANIPIGITLAKTEGADTLACSVSTFDIAIAAAMTEASDTAASAVSVLVGVSGTSVEPDDTLASYVAVALMATCVTYDDVETITASAEVTNGPELSLAVTERDDTCSSSVDVPLLAALAVYEADDVLDGVFINSLQAHAVIQEAADVCAAVATVVVAATTQAQEEYDSVVTYVSVFLHAQVAAVEAGDIIGVSWTKVGTYIPDNACFSTAITKKLRTHTVPAKLEDNVVIRSLRTGVLVDSNESQLSTSKPTTTVIHLQKQIEV